MSRPRLTWQQETTLVFAGVGAGIFTFGAAFGALMWSWLKGR
jgi:hypothetical protein